MNRCFFAPLCAFAALGILIAPFSPTRVWAQPPPAASSTPSADPIAGPIRKGDTVRVVVAGAATMGGDFRVEADGSIFIPQLGQINVAGKAQGDAATAVARQIEAKKLLKQADVAVYIVGRKAREVVINGAVGNQGRQPIKDAALLSEALENAAPLPAADLTRVVVTRDGKEILVNYKRFRNGEATGSEVNPALEDNDRIYVYSGAPGEGTVRVLGEVKDATKVTIPINQGTTVGQVLQSVGGVTEYADRNNIFVQRGTDRIPVSYDEILRNAPGKDILLKDRDEVNIPRLERPKQFTVTGAVVRPGTLPLQTRVTLLDAVAQAGGPSDGAQQEKVEVRRRNTNGLVSTSVYDLRKDTDASAELRDGDVITVPFGKKSSGNNIGTIVGILSGVAVIFATLRR